MDDCRKIVRTLSTEGFDVSPSVRDCSKIFRHVPHVLYCLFKGMVAYQLAGALLQVDFGLLDAKVGKSATAALDGRQRVHDLAITLDVGVHHTEDVLV